MAKKNWDILRRQAATDTLRNRDVYESQQLDRTKVGKKQSFFTRHCNRCWTCYGFDGVGNVVIF